LALGLLRFFAALRPDDARNDQIFGRFGHSLFLHPERYLGCSQSSNANNIPTTMKFPHPTLPNFGCRHVALLAAVLLVVLPASTLAQTTYSWIATTNSSIADLANWSPTPPDLATLSANSIVFGMDAASNVNADVTGTFNIANVTFSRTGGQVSIRGNGSTATLAIAGNLTVSDSATPQYILRQNGANTLSVTVAGNMNLNGATTRFGIDTSSGNSSQISDVLITGTTNVGGTLTFATIIGTVNLGNVVMAGGTLNPIHGRNASDNGTAQEWLNIINMNRLHGTGTIQGSKDFATLTTTGRIVVNGTVDGTYSGTINNGLANNVIELTKNGSSTLTLSGNNTYTGNTTVINGMLVGDHNSAFGTSAVLANGGVTRIAATRTISNAVTLNGGELNVRGTASGAVTFGASGGRLSGDGTLTQAIAFNNVNQVLAPGNSPGILSFDTSQTWSSFTYEWELNSWADTAIAGANFDQISITGSLNLTGASANSIRLDLFSLLGDNTPGAVPGFVEADRQWIIVTTTGGVTGFDSIHWDIVTTGFTSSPAWAGTWSVTASANQIFLNYTAIPEPGTGLLLLLSAGAWVVLRRRRNA